MGDHPARPGALPVLRLRLFSQLRKRAMSALKYAGMAALVFVLLSTGSVFLLRFVRPLASALMVERRVESWFTKGTYTSRYQWVDLDDISPAMGVAVIAAEDQKFIDHFGFDWQAIEKALARNGQGSRTRGASTLSQQTAKNLFLWPGRTWLRKGFEAYFTVLLETLWPKRRILEVYLNIAEFGDGVYGVEAAAQRYFHKPASRLNGSEAALLAAVLPSPRRFRVNAPNSYVRERQQWILNQMGQLGGVAALKALN
ncbi:MAG TPA: monofunctional biosynthetic peptidoglycan transglycosylase [Terriglobia bacterium]|nr:monofunctional biosynthetic peptidoglycan transglycosylase [Terriglobia bacterium]